MLNEIKLDFLYAKTGWKIRLLIIFIDINFLFMKSSEIPDKFIEK